MIISCLRRPGSKQFLISRIHPRNLSAARDQPDSSFSFKGNSGGDVKARGTDAQSASKKITRTVSGRVQHGRSEEKRTGSRTTKHTRHARWIFSVPCLGRNLFQLDADWRQDANTLTQRFLADGPMTVSSPDDIVVLLILLLEKNYEVRAIHLFVQLTKYHKAERGLTFDLPALSLLCKTALRCSRYNALQSFMAHLFQVLGDHTPTAVGQDGQDLTVHLVRQLFLTLIESYFHRHHYQEVVELVDQMRRYHMRGTRTSFMQALQSLFRRCHQPSTPSCTEPPHQAFPRMLSDLRAILDQMLRDGVYANRYIRAVLIHGLTKSLLHQADSISQLTWATVHPALQRLRKDDGSALLQLTWAAALLDIKEHRVQGRAAAIIEKIAAESDALWYEQTLSQLEQNPIFAGLSFDPHSDESLNYLTFHTQRLHVFIRAYLLRDDFSSAAYWLRRLYAMFLMQNRATASAAVKEVSSSEIAARVERERKDVSERFEAAIIRFVSRAVSRKAIVPALDALSLSAGVPSPSTFVRLWKRIFVAQSTFRVPWHGPAGIQRSLEVFAGIVDQRSDLHTLSILDADLNSVFHDHATIFYHIEAANLSSPSELRRAERLQLLAYLHMKCGILLSEDFWHSRQGFTSDLMEDLRGAYSEAMSSVAIHGVRQSKVGDDVNRVEGRKVEPTIVMTNVFHWNGNLKSPDQGIRRRVAQS